ncbi:carboxylesterase/lipase family protein [Rudaeicoccus suwonensis]|uniref:Carboxylic ester hydrolase n=1 Tax=Rudaeicoccus suwonensis TaxID=657409 RepID=A0A561EC91_9MICO|nr:carboxylesterase family protein [Rudaeicoccus suwonensis]TWE13219.1 para-nitrobenzyl esterase [Rudaeicoccus suwonensis]
MTNRHMLRPLTAAATAGSLAVALTVAGSAYAASDRISAPPACTPGTTVTTGKGAVCGLTTDGVTTYGSVPYAAAPVGKLRWQSPQPHAAWKGVLQATTPAPECSNAFAQTGTSENCLNLEIETPAGTRPGEKLPVMFEFHGGGFLGEARTDDGSNLVRTGKVVYVYVNYRLGVLGFLADKALGAHSGDYGLQDQQAGLRWVQQNISRFGGNPSDVTVFGESAGGASTCAQVASPTAKGLFKNAISISGFYNYQNNIVWSKADCKSSYFTEAQAQAVGATFAKKVGCGKAIDVLACLRKIPAATLIKEQGQVGDPTGGGTIGPIINGTTLTMSPVTALTTGHANHVTLITDVGRDEFNGGVYSNSLTPDVVVADNTTQFYQLVNEEFGRLAPTVEKLYPLSRFASPFTDYRTIMADSASVCPMLQVDAAASRHMTIYADIDADADNPAGENLTLPLGAQHSGTNGLVHFDTSKLDANQAALQLQLLLEWTHFAATGNPVAANTPAWPSYLPGQQQVMMLQPADTSMTEPASFVAAQHNCGFWDTVTHY